MKTGLFGHIHVYRSSHPYVLIDANERLFRNSPFLGPNLEINLCMEAYLKGFHISLGIGRNSI